MTIGAKIWADAIFKVGVGELWENPKEMIPELGLEVIRQIDELLADIRRRIDPDDDH